MEFTPNCEEGGCQVSKLHNKEHRIKGDGKRNKIRQLNKIANKIERNSK